MVKRRVDSLYTKEQAEEIARVWESHPAKGRTPNSLAGKVRALRKRGINIHVPPFAHGTTDLAQTILSGNIQSQAHTDWRNERISKSLLKADMTAGQTASARSKRATSEELIRLYQTEYGFDTNILPSAPAVANWAVRKGYASPDDEVNLKRRVARALANLKSRTVRT